MVAPPLLPVIGLSDGEFEFTLGNILVLLSSYLLFKFDFNYQNVFAFEDMHSNLYKRCE